MSGGAEIPGAIWAPAPGPWNGTYGHWEPRPAGHLPEFIVGHHSDDTLAQLLAAFTSPTGINASHATIARDGTKYQHVPLVMAAFHAGDLAANWASFGVETVRLWGENGPGTAGYEPITDAQYQSWQEVGAFLASWAGWPAFDSSRLYPHHAFTQTTCPGDLDLERILGGMADLDVTAPNTKELFRQVAAIYGSTTQAFSSYRIMAEDETLTLKTILDAVNKVTAAGGTLDPQVAADLHTIAEALRKLEVTPPAPPGP